MNRRKGAFIMKKHVLLLSMLLVALIIPAAWLNLQTGLYVGEDFLRSTDAGYGPLTLQHQADGMQVTGSVDGFSWDAAVQTQDGGMTVTLADGNVYAGTWDGEHLCDERGMPYAYTSGGITIVVNNEPSPPDPILQADTLCRMALGQTEARGSLWCVLVGVIVYGIGMLSIFFPDFMYFLGRRWCFEQPELSDAGRFCQRLGGVVALAGGAVVMYLPLFI